MFKKYSLFLKNQYVEYTYEQSWNVDLSWNISPPSLSNSYIEHMKKNGILSHFAIYNPSTDPTKYNLLHTEKAYMSRQFSNLPFSTLQRK